MLSSKQITLAVLLAVCVVACSAQLTFTPGWGKRSANNVFAASPGMVDRPMGCKSPTESLISIFHFVEAEAQKLLECNQK